MKNHLTPFLFYSFLTLFTSGYGQEEIIYLKNPSFEGTPAEGTLNGQMIEGWYDCGFPGETIPDIHPVIPGTFQVETQPFHGNTYIGLVVRDNETLERISQRLSSPMQGGISYAFSIATARSLAYFNRIHRNGRPINYATPAKLRIWGGSGLCDRDELLAESSLIIQTDWEITTFRLEPEKNIEYIILEAYYKTPSPFPYNGNILLDNASALVPIPAEPEQIRYEFAEPHMGTAFKIILYASDPVLAETAADTAFSRIHEIDQSMSNYREDSEINRLFSPDRSYPDTVEISTDLWNVLQYGQSVSRITRGAFDMTAGQLTKLWRRAFRQKERPGDQEISNALQSAGFERFFLLGNNRIVLNHPGFRFDLGGIAKGYAVDKAFEALEKHGITIALIDGGGDLRAGDPPPGEEGWKIELQKSDPSDSTALIKQVANIAIASSGDTYQFLEMDGKRLSHIIDPRTGQPIESSTVVTVTAPTCMQADVWATALSVERDDNILEMLKEQGLYFFFFPGN